MKKENLVLVSGALILIIGFGMFAFAQRDRKKSDQVPVVESDEKLYTNALYGISFRYPQAYVVKEQNSDSTHRVHDVVTLIHAEDANFGGEGGSDGPRAITLQFFQNNLDKQSARGFITGSSDSNYKLGDGIISTTTVAGYEALAYNWDGLYPGKSTVFLHGDTIVMASVTYNALSDRILDDFESIMRTLRLEKIRSY